MLSRAHDQTNLLQIDQVKFDTYSMLYIIYSAPGTTTTTLCMQFVCQFVSVYINNALAC